MEEGKADRKPTRDYHALSDSPWTLWDVMFARRSHRKYLPVELGDEFTAALDRIVALASEARGAVEGSIIPVLEPQVGDEIRRRLYKGLANKINLWLARSPVKAFIVMSVPVADMKGNRPSQLPRVAMAVEDCVLWLTEQGLGTCWLGGVNASQIKAILGLEPGLTVPVAICLGRPSLKLPAVSYSNFALYALSRRRKPLSKIAYDETMEKPYTPTDIGRERFSAGPTQDIGGLLELIRGGKGGVSAESAPLDLAIEACLEAARIAPSGSNLQAWHFIVIRDEKRLEKLADACGGSAGWRAAIVAAGNVMTISTGMLDRPFWMIDVPIALSHISLMAASMGCATQVHTDGIDEDAIRGLVRLTGRVRTVGVVGIN